MESCFQGELSLSGLSVIIPAWNEESRLGRTLERFLPALESRSDPFEVLVVVDGVRDRTAEVARAYAARGVRVLEFHHKLGKGGAILAGFREARYEYVGYLDADGPIPPSEMHRIVDHLKEVDCVVASRWARGARVLRHEPLFNRVAGRLWNVLVQGVLFLPLKDTQCGAKFMRRSVLLPALRAVALTNRAFDVDVLYHIRKQGRSIRELPVTWEHDPETRMPIGKAIPIMFLSLVGVRVMNTPLGQRVPKTWVDWFLEEFGST
ncbi:MAG: glycosyltransferase [Euryarchaeota archaeon]|nr:glycosyltransferase [Euryarchaeota archaeon]MDE1880163.1 glycosyltransferase [Euryarchaeota archaeon]MDE2045379.1 glycosyltransferase [Thermoplasmata archaeon]